MMNFRFKTLSLLLAGAAMGMTSCQNEDLLPNEGGQGNGNEISSSKKVYVSAGISLPSAGGSRSATDSIGDTNSNANPDYEYGYDYENDVRTMILMFTTTTDEYLCYSVVTGLEKAPTGKNYEFEVLAELKYDDLQAAYNDPKNLLSSSQNVNVYAYCNYTADLEEKIEGLTVGSKDWRDWSGNVTEPASLPGQTPTIVNTIWAPRAFLMTNYSMCETTFPADLQAWDDYADKSSPFKVTEGGVQTANLKAIKVERSAARIDFKDGSPTKNQTYKIMTDVHMIGQDDDDNETIETTTHNFFNVKLTRMSLVNMSKNFYYLRRVSADGTGAGTLLGIEGIDNYVVDTDATEKKAKSIKTADDSASKFFNFPLYMKDEQDPKGTAYNRDGWYSDNIESVLEGTQDTWESTNGGAGQYRIWRYVTENTIPGAENQKTVQSTGVVFKGKLMAGENIGDTYDTNDELAAEERYISQAVEDALKNTENLSETELPVLYSFNGFLYAGYEELIEKAVEDGKGGQLFTRIENILKAYKLSGTEYSTSGEGAVLDMETAYNIVTGKDRDHTIAMTDDAMVEVAAKNGITVYKASTEDGTVGYYCYYFYWNRHNDNGKSGLMGPMEFATVRNNVYKLSVTKINQFGHPRIKAYDPDPEEEERDDEDPLRYIEVHVDVLPWVVRENNIEF